MTPETWNWIATAIAVGAAAATAWQAAEARKARRGAVAAETRAVATSERVAAALEARNARDALEASKYVSPWRFDVERGETFQRIRVSYESDSPAVAVRWHLWTHPEILIPSYPPPSEMRRGDEISWTWGMAHHDGPNATLAITWRHEGDDEERRERKMLSL